MDRGTLMAVIDTKFDLVGASYFSWKTHDVKSVVWERWDETSAQEIAFQERSPRKIIPIEVHGAISIDSLSRGSLSRAINFKSQGKQRSSIQRVKLFQTSLTNLSRVLNFRAKGRKVCYESRYERAFVLEHTGFDAFEATIILLCDSFLNNSTTLVKVVPQLSLCREMSLTVLIPQKGAQL